MNAEPALLGVGVALPFGAVWPQASVLSALCCQDLPLRAAGRTEGVSTAPA